MRSVEGISGLQAGEEVKVIAKRTSKNQLTPPHSIQVVPFH